MDSLVGFRFKPTDEEIIHLLKKKRLDPGFSVRTIKEIDIYKYEPWELEGLSGIQCKEEVWYFYCEPYYKYAKSKREHRRTKTGYWKVTGKGSKMKAKKSREVIGNKRILPFCRPDISSKKAKTEWVMHEISVEDDPLYKKDFVVCRVERKRDTKLGVSTSNGDESITRNHVAENTSLESLSPPDHQLVSNRNHVAENTSLHSIPTPNQQSVSCSNDIVEPSFEAEPQLLAQFNPPGGYDKPNNFSFSAPQSLIYQESSYCNGFSYSCDLSNSQYCGDMIDLRAFLNEPFPEEPGQTSTPDFNSSKSDESSRGQTFSPDFNSSKSDGGVYGKNGDDTDTESIIAWVKGLFEN